MNAPTIHYGTLLREVQPQVIRDSQAHRRHLAEVDRLMVENAKNPSPAYEELLKAPSHATAPISRVRPVLRSARAMALPLDCSSAPLVVRRACLSRVIPLGERHLRQIVSEFATHYHAERNHQGLGNKLIEPMNDNAANSGRVLRRTRLGGVLNYYYRDAA